MPQVQLVLQFLVQHAPHLGPHARTPSVQAHGARLHQTRRDVLNETRRRHVPQPLFVMAAEQVLLHLLGEVHKGLLPPRRGETNQGLQKNNARRLLAAGATRMMLPIPD